MRRTGDIHIATDLGVPRSTAAGWLRADRGGVVSLDVVDMCEVDLQAEVVRLRHRVATLTAVVGLLLAVRRAVGSRLERAHVFDRAMRAVVVRAAERARRVLPASSVLRILGISASRHAAWTRYELGCAFGEYVACPRSVPNQLTPRQRVTWLEDPHRGQRRRWQLSWRGARMGPCGTASNSACPGARCNGGQESDRRSESVPERRCK